MVHIVPPLVVCRLSLHLLRSFTLRYTMAQPRLFPWADTAAILSRLRGTTHSERLAAGRVLSGSNVTMQAALSALRGAFPEDLLSEQERLTLCRAFDTTTHQPKTTTKYVLMLMLLFCVVLMLLSVFGCLAPPPCVACLLLPYSRNITSSVPLCCLCGCHNHLTFPM